VSWDFEEDHRPPGSLSQSSHDRPRIGSRGLLYILARKTFQAYSPLGPLATKKKVASRLRGSWRVLRGFIVVLREAWPLVAVVEEISPMGIHPQGDGRPRASCRR
jgi:hypothetical protein